VSEPPPREHSLFVDGREFRVTLAKLTGLQIRALAAINREYELVLEGRGSEPDTPIRDEQVIDLVKEPPRFFTHPPTTFGLLRAKR
jgi:hypothetical protein